MAGLAVMAVLAMMSGQGVQVRPDRSCAINPIGQRSDSVQHAAPETGGATVARYSDSFLTSLSEPKFVFAGRKVVV